MGMIMTSRDETSVQAEGWENGPINDSLHRPGKLNSCLNSKTSEQRFDTAGSEKKMNFPASVYPPQSAWKMAMPNPSE